MTTIESARASGLTAGGDDAETWIAERAASLAEDGRALGADELRRSLNFQESSAPDEGLINGLEARDLVELIGYDVRDNDGDWTPEASAFFAGYNDGWRETVEKQLASLA